MPVEEAYRIRTGESGEETLQAHPDAAAQATPDGVSVTGGARPARAMPPPSRRRGSSSGCASLHLEMVDAVLAGEGLGRRRRARRAAPPARPWRSWSRGCGRGGAVAGGGQAELGALRRYVADRVRGPPGAGARRVGGEVPIASGDEMIGRVVLLRRRPATPTRSSSCTSRRSPA